MWYVSYFLLGLFSFALLNPVHVEAKHKNHHASKEEKKAEKHEKKEKKKAKEKHKQEKSAVKQAKERKNDKIKERQQKYERDSGEQATRDSLGTGAHEPLSKD